MSYHFPYSTYIYQFFLLTGDRRMINYRQASHSMARQFTRNYLIISSVPLLLLLILILTGVIITRDYLADLIMKSTYSLNADAEHSLQQLGEQMIRTKARDVAHQVEIYFRMHPDMDIKDMRKDPFFVELASQKVGETGYTSVYEAGTWIFRVHPNQKLIDQDVSFLAKDLPSWWAIVGATHSGEEVSGYYDWRDPDGTLRTKYMTITPAKVRLNGTIMMVAATTYISEFSAPVAAMKVKADKVVGNYQQYTSKMLIGFDITAGFVVLLTFSGTYYLGSRAALKYILPIMQLSESAKNFGEGKWNVSIPEEVILRQDEIGTMAKSFNFMSHQLKELFRHLDKRVTELKQAQEALKISEEHYRSLFDGIPIGLYRSSPDGRFLDANPMMIQMMGYPDRETFMQSNAKTMYADPGERAAWQATLHEKAGVHLQETQLKKYDGTKIWAEDHSRAMQDESGKVLYYEGSVKDITEEKRLKTHLQQVERLEAIGTLAGGIAHDFNNLLMVIQGTVSLLLNSTDATHPHYKHFTNIEKQTQRGSKLTKQLLGYARKGKYEVRPLNMNDTIMESREALRRTRKDIHIHCNLAPDIYPVDADVYQMEQVLMNLYINAADAMINGGDLILTTRNVSSAEIVNDLYKIKEGNYLLLTVEDTGTGMDQKTMDRIFEPFFTTKDIDKGTGLGLASVYGIVKGHGGYIQVASKLGRGSTFSIYLPASQKPIVVPPAEPKKILAGHGTILIVDDEKPVLDVGAEMLKDIGYKVFTAQNGLTAIETYKAHEDEIDLVILDMTMPHLGGGQIFDLLRQINPTIAVLLSSGYSIEGRAADIINRGCNGFIQKPFSMEDIADKIKSIIRTQ
jgi:two-component system, cell cycle sensor histidine kinase and response regulator CckA